MKGTLFVHIKRIVMLSAALALLAVMLPGVAHADSSARDDVLSILEDYFAGQATKDEAVDAVDEFASSIVTKNGPPPPPGATIQTVPGEPDPQNPCQDSEGNAQVQPYWLHSSVPYTVTGGDPQRMASYLEWRCTVTHFQTYKQNSEGVWVPAEVQIRPDWEVVDVGDGMNDCSAGEPWDLPYYMGWACNEEQGWHIVNVTNPPPAGSVNWDPAPACQNWQQGTDPHRGNLPLTRRNPNYDPTLTPC